MRVKKYKCCYQFCYWVYALTATDATIACETDHHQNTMPLPPDTPSDEELIAACRNGEVDAWLRMVQRYERLVFSVPLRYRLSRPEAEDVVQNTFIILMQSLNDLRPDSNLGTWLCLVARRHTWRVLKRNAREIRPESDDDDVDWSQFAEALGAKDVEAFDYWELADLLNRGLAQLSERCRDLLMALYFDVDKPSYADLAARWRMPVDSIGPTHSRCVERLRQILADS